MELNIYSNLVSEYSKKLVTYEYFSNSRFIVSNVKEVIGKYTPLNFLNEKNSGKENCVNDSISINKGDFLIIIRRNFRIRTNDELKLISC